MLIKFKVRGNLRFLSHAEMIKVFQRACVRAGIKAEYTQGFNPRPKLSLPLPRSVGVESDDDLLCLRVSCDPDESRVANCESQIKAGLSSQLPEGCELLSVSIAKAKTSFQPSAATYVLVLHQLGASLSSIGAGRQEYLNEKLKATIKRLLESESLNLQRRDEKKSKFRNVDVRPFLKSIEFDNKGRGPNRSKERLGTRITVECKISSAGSIRIDEILKLLELDVEKLAAPIRRTSIQWQVSEL